MPLDLSGLNLYDATNGSAKHTFPANTILQPGKAIVVFGGENGTATNSGIPGIADGVSSKTTTAPNPEFGGSIVQVASTYTFGNVTSALGLNNTGANASTPADRVRIVNGTIAADGTVTGTMIADVAYFNTTAATIADKSLTRLDGETGGNRDLRSTGSPNDLHPVINNPSCPYDGRAYSPGFRRDGNPFP
jgi:hypothetical protein